MWKYQWLRHRRDIVLDEFELQSPYSFNFSINILGKCIDSSWNGSNSTTTISIHVVHPYSRINTTATWTIFCFTLSDRSDFHMIDIQSIAVYAFARCTFMSFSVKETLLLWYVNLFTNFREQPFIVQLSPFLLKRVFFVCIHMEANGSCYLIQTMQQGFDLGRYICDKRNVIRIVWVRNTFFRVSSASCPF